MDWTLLMGLTGQDKSHALLLEDFMQLPTCPLCAKGPLVPLSESERPFAIWVCSQPGCSYAISNSTHTYFYKGNAGQEMKQKEKKEYVQYDF
jgi:hypothetical protein